MSLEIVYKFIFYLVLYKFNILKERIMYRHLDLKVGFSCNNNCRFCVQGHKKHLGNKTTKEIKKELEEARSECDSIVFTGGEPTIRPDILEIISHAKKLGYDPIQIQSNGRRFYYKKFCEDLIKAGANEFSPALHGHISGCHDFLTRSPGSWKQTTQGIKNLRELDQYIITNTVVVKPNYRYIPELAELFVKLKVDQFQFAFVHAVGNAEKNYDMMMPWVSLTVPYIKKGLQIGINNGIKVMAEAIPFCVMDGYEKYCSETFIPPTQIRDFGGIIDPKFEETRVKEGKLKHEKCNKCKFDLICEGPWREYPEKRGWGEFKPIPGKKIKSIEEI
jgi:MoaA/NifB/PqqE/SkfB family radical SAM enzyme